MTASGSVIGAALYVSTSFRHHTLPPELTMSKEQAVHDRINLYRLARRLEKSIAEEGWQIPGNLKDSEAFPHAVWIRTQGTLGVSVSLHLPIPPLEIIADQSV